MLISIRTFITPRGELDSIIVGEPNRIELPDNSSLDDLIKKIFSKNHQQIGIMAINGKITNGSVILSEGDSIDIFGHVGGG